MGGFGEKFEERSSSPYSKDLSDDGKVSKMVPRDRPSALKNKDDESVFNTRDVVKTLESLMNKVTLDKCTPETVNAACNCADKITQILRVHLDVEKLKRKFL